MKQIFHSTIALVIFSLAWGVCPQKTRTMLSRLPAEIYTGVIYQDSPPPLSGGNAMLLRNNGAMGDYTDELFINKSN